MTAFPLPLPSLAIVRGGKPGAYLIGALFTAAYRAKAERLAASCERFGLAYEFHEVPSVHRSISVRGSDDLSCTKPNFIQHLLAARRKPVLYVDADCEFLSPPVLVDALVRSRRDFAIYNWCADDYNDRFVPIELGGGGKPSTGRQFYRYYGSVDFLSDSQILCSGLVQFYAYSLAAQRLLKMWHQTIASHLGCADDQALDFTFNNLGPLSRLLLKTAWLPKAYARIGWWIYAEPVINHADIPSPVSDFADIQDPRRKPFYWSLSQRRTAPGLLPRDCIIDTQNCLLVRRDGDALEVVGRTDARFWT